MKTGMFKAPLLLLGLCCVSAVTPIEKVVQLLKDLQGKVESQGAKEAAQYDKYSCFCKNQAEFKKNAIEKTEEKIEILKADISDLESKIQANNQDIATLGEDITKLKKDIKTETDKRTKEHEEYLVKEKDFIDAIDACAEAVEALKASKKEMKGAKLDLAQFKNVAFNVKMAQDPGALEEAVILMKKAKKAAQDVSGTADAPGSAPAFEYGSNDIIATIQDLEATFKENKKTLDDEEGEAQFQSDKKVLGFSNEKDFKTKEKKEKEVLVAQQEEEKVAAEKEKDDATADKESDESFVKVLTSSCETKAKEWDQRSKARAEEITALAQAERTLAEGAVQQYSVNKKLVGLVDKSFKAVVAKAAEAPAAPKPAETKRSPSFLQLRNVQAHSQAAAVQHLLSHLDSAAARTHSPVLAAIAMKVQLKGVDHFVNVRKLINDLLDKLKADAESEATTKGFCDTEMAKAINGRDEASLKIEEQDGIISKKTSEAAEKAEEIEALSGEIAQLNKDILDSEELRKSEKANNEATVAEAKAGTDAVKSALETLKGFYGAALVQYKPPDSDRHGETVDDAAPEVFSGEYKGATGESGGIIGILEVIQSDFERTVTTTEAAEKKAVEDHTKYLEGAKADIKEKAKSKEDAEGAKKDAEQAVIQAKDDLYDAKTSLTNAEGELEKLSPLCVSGTETYAERTARRQEEIAALKEAMTILDDWQK